MFPDTVFSVRSVYRSPNSLVLRSAVMAKLAITNTGLPKTAPEVFNVVLRRWRARAYAVSRHLDADRPKGEQFRRLVRMRNCRPYGFVLAGGAAPHTCGLHRVCPWCYCRQIAPVVTAVLRTARLLALLNRNLYVLSVRNAQSYEQIPNRIECSDLGRRAIDARDRLLKVLQTEFVGAWSRFTIVPTSAQQSEQLNPRPPFMGLLSMLVLLPHDRSVRGLNVSTDRSIQKAEIVSLNDPKALKGLLVRTLAYPQQMMRADPEQTGILLGQLAATRAKWTRMEGLFKHVDDLCDSIAHLPRIKDAADPDAPEE